MIGRTLSHFEILDELGRGGMGVVYRARDTKLNRDVAIKVLPEDFAGNEDRLARFRREAQLLASLNHPNIAAIYGREKFIQDRVSCTHHCIIAMPPTPEKKPPYCSGALSESPTRITTRFHAPMCAGYNSPAGESAHYLA